MCMSIIFIAIAFVIYKAPYGSKHPISPPSSSYTTPPNTQTPSWMGTVWKYEGTCIFIFIFSVSSILKKAIQMIALYKV